MYKRQVLWMDVLAILDNFVDFAILVFTIFAMFFGWVCLQSWMVATAICLGVSGH